MPPARFSAEGVVLNDDWPNFQIDGYGTWLWSLREHLGLTAARSLPDELVPAVERVGRYLAVIGTEPCFDVWEENGGSVHTATLGCVYAGLVAAASMLGDTRLSDRADSIGSEVVRARPKARADSRSRITIDRSTPHCSGCASPSVCVTRPSRLSWKRPLRWRPRSISKAASGATRRTPTTAGVPGPSSPPRWAGTSPRSASSTGLDGGNAGSRSGSIPTVASESSSAASTATRRSTPSGCSDGASLRGTWLGRTPCSSCSVDELDRGPELAGRQQKMTITDIYS